MPLFQVILSTAAGAVHELDLRAPDACTAAYIAGDEVREQQPHALVTNVHSRRVGNGDEYTTSTIHNGA